jgi:N4-gp56 family major capsid protein
MADNPTTKASVQALVPTIISKEVEFKSQESGFRQFRQFCVVKEDFSKQPGDTLSIPKIDDLAPAQDLTEGSTLRGSGKKLSVGSISITPTEKGDEVQYTEYSKLTSQSELQDIIVELLARQSSKKENLDIRDVMFNAPRIKLQGSATSASEVGKLSYTDIDYVVEELEAAEAAKFGTGGNEHFIGFIHPYGRTALIDALRSTSDYANAVPGLYAGEIGQYNRVRFIETAYCPFRAYVKTRLASDAGKMTVAADAEVVVSDDYCVSETFTIKATSATEMTVTGSASGVHKVFVNGTEKEKFTLTELAANDIIVAGSGASEDERKAKSPATIKKGAITAITTSGDVATFVTQRNILTKIMGARHIAYGAIKPVTMLGAESFDYGRVIGVAWNAFYDAVVLNDDYGWVIESKR